MSQRFGICRCYYSGNVFIDEWKEHVTLQMASSEHWESAFREKYFHRRSFKLAFEQAGAELERRRNKYKHLQILRQTVTDQYVPKYPHIYHLRPEFLHPDFFLAHQTDPKSWMDSHPDHSFSFPIFTQDFCQLLELEVAHFESTSLPRNRPNSMNKKGVILDDIGFTRFLDKLRNEYLNPICQRLYNLHLDSHRAFTVSYNDNEDSDKGLDSHFDNSEVTLNICLNQDFKGGNLEFDGLNSQEPSQESKFEFAHRQGYGILHWGSHIHKALPISSGHRMNLVIWMRSSQVRNKICPMCRQCPNVQGVEVGYGDGFTIPN